MVVSANSWIPYQIISNLQDIQRLAVRRSYFVFVCSQYAEEVVVTGKMVVDVIGSVIGLIP